LCGCGQLGDAAVKKIANEVIDELQRDLLGAEVSPAEDSAQGGGQVSALPAE